jgi:integrase
LPRIRPYDVRHTSATLLLSRDVNIKVVSERLGHESIGITLKHYAHALPGMQETAAAAIDDLFGPIGTPLAHEPGDDSTI